GQASAVCQPCDLAHSGWTVRSVNVTRNVLARCPSKLAGGRAWPDWRTDNEYCCKENWTRDWRHCGPDRNGGCGSSAPGSCDQPRMGCRDWVWVVCARDRACQSLLRLGLSSLWLWIRCLPVLRLQLSKLWIRVRGVRSLPVRLLRVW